MCYCDAEDDGSPRGAGGGSDEVVVLVTRVANNPESTLSPAGPDISKIAAAHAITLSFSLITSYHVIHAPNPKHAMSRTYTFFTVRTSPGEILPSVYDGLTIIHDTFRDVSPAAVLLMLK